MVNADTSLTLTRAFEEAEALSRDAFLSDEVPVGAVIILNGQIISRAHNRKEGTQDPTGHAEIIAIREAAKALGSWRLENCELVVTLEPCPMCLGAIQQSRLSKVFYGAKDPKGGAISLGYSFHSDERLNHRFEADWIEREGCSQILKDFFSLKRSEAKKKLPVK